MPLDFNKIKFGSVVGIGEASHGTREYQRIRLQLLRFLHKQGSMQVLIEAPYAEVERIKTIKNINQLDQTVEKSAIFDFYKSVEFKKILRYLVAEGIPFFGTDIDHGRGANIPTVNKIAEWVSAMNDRLYSKANWGKKEWEFREHCMQELARRLYNGARQV